MARSPRARPQPGAAIIGTGSAVPDRVVSNAEIGPPAGVDADWIVRKTAILERRWARPDQATSDLATEAAAAALRDSGIVAEQLTVIVVATSTPDRPQPPTAAYVQQRLGAPAAAAFDMNAVCSGFVFALGTVEAMIARGGGYGLVIGADIYSRILNPADRRTVPLFGDGAGAVVVGPVRGRHGIRDYALHTFGDLSPLIEVPAGGSRTPYTASTVLAGSHYFRMDGRGVREFVTSRLPQLIKEFLADSGVVAADIAHFVPHQANGVMLDEVFAELNLPNATVHRSVQNYGNTGAASIPITLDAADRGGALQPGDLILLAAFGGGMSVGLALLTW
ncbi:ketoacyl-ACP synthase III [Nocardia sp. NPDC005825]|uniref:3-oxoacyl-ACP synthase III family protein n=1 Tax=unclassified Nocardia TaxID=2637762 RepID=UPI0033CEE2A8